MVCFFSFLFPYSFLLTQTKNDTFNEKIYHYFYRSQYDSVLVYYSQHAPEESDKDSLANVLNLIAKCYYYVGQNGQSLQVYQKILQNPPRDPAMLARVCCTYAEVLIETAQYETAAKQLLFAEGVLSAIDQPGLRALMFNNRGVLYLRTSDFPRALQDLTIALSVAREVNDNRLVSQILTNIGVVYYTIGNYQDALKAFGTALELDLPMRHDKDLAVDYLNIGNVYYDLNDKHKSIEFFQQAKRAYAAINDSAGISFVLGSLSTVYIDLKKYEQASESLHEAVKIARMTGDRLGEAEWLYSLAMIDHEKGNYADSYTALENVSEQFENLKSYVHYGHVLIDMGKCKEKLYEYDVAEKLFRLSARNYESRNLHNEVWRANASLAMLYTRMNRSMEADSLFIASIQRIEDTRDELASELTTYFIEDNRLEVYRSYVLFLIKQERYERAFDIFEKAKARNIADILYANDKGTSAGTIHSDSTFLLEYFLHKDGSYVFVKYLKDIKVIPIGKKELIDQLVLDYITQIKQKRKDREAFLLLSKKLYRAIWEPIEKEIERTADVTIIPDEWLFYLPFESLFDGQKFVTEKFEIVYSPSAAVSQKLHDSGQNRTRSDFISVYSQSRFANMLYRPSGFEDLSYVELEIDHIQKLFQNSAAFYSGKSLTTRMISDSALERSSIIHFAAHGINNFEKPSLSAIFLYEPDSLSNGLLTASDIQKLHLDHKLVVLSACETSLGHLLKGEGMLGLTRAFMIAGASSVVAAMWNIYDQSTAEFMRIFYEKKVKEKMSNSKALQQTKIEMIHHHEWSDPAYWASFVIWGAGF